jgi:hypothetical protein
MKNMNMESDRTPKKKTVPELYSSKQKIIKKERQGH